MYDRQRTRELNLWWKEENMETALSLPETQGRRPAQKLSYKLTANGTQKKLLLKKIKKSYWKYLILN